MKIKIEKGVAEGAILAPPSKSYAHRLLISAALADGESVIVGISESEDMSATLDCVKVLGAEYEREGDTVRIKGAGKRITESSGALKAFFCRESGSTLRFMIPIAMLSGDTCEFIGTERLISRGIGVYTEIFAEKGIKAVSAKDRFRLTGKLTGGHYRVRADVSSQFISGLLFSLPLADGDSVIELLPPVESKKYIDITVDTIRKFGIAVDVDGNTVKIKGNQKYRPASLTVEGDYSNAAFLDAFNFIGGDVRVGGLNENSLQGDRVYGEYFKALSDGCPTLDISDCPDLGPVLFALAAAKNGARFTGTRRLKIKESDRAAAMAEELRKFGAEVEVDENTVTVKKTELHAPTEILSGHNDHRIVMSMAVLLTLFGGIIDESEAVRKSYPGFFEDLGKLGIYTEKE